MDWANKLQLRFLSPARQDGTKVQAAALELEFD